MVTAAELYWVRGMKIDAVARELDVSRSTASRLLAKARKEHIIEFRVHREEDPAARLRQALQDTFGVYASVPMLSPRANAEMRRLIVGRDAAILVDALVHVGAVVGVTWGATVEAVSSHLRPQRTDGVHVVQVHGSGNVAALGKNYAGQILERFGAAFDAEVHVFPVPAVFDFASTRDAMWLESSVRRVLAMRSRIDLLVTSVGTPNGISPSRLYQSGYLSSADMRELEREHTVGNVASVFFRADGSTDGISVNQRSTGLPFDELRRIPLRLFVASDARKAPAIRAALDAGLVTHLVLDPATAEAVLHGTGTPADA